MADGKWVAGLTPDTPVEEAAREVLGVRLGVVAEALPAALAGSGADPELVHRLRVGTRRATAALRIFADCLPRKVRKAARRRLRAVRRAAGAARDWDVFLIGLRGRRKGRAGEQPGLDFLAGYGLGQREAAQAGLEGVDDPEDLEAFVRSTVAEVRAPAGGGVLIELARPLLLGLMNELEKSASEDLRDYARLHRVRIAGKRLRYAMEVFADCFDVPFREELYPLVEEVQEVLGRANDSHVAAGHLCAVRERLRSAWPKEWARLRAGVEGLLRFHQRRLPQERRKFVKWWGRWREAIAGERLAVLLERAAVSG
jgi:CHAD domain-containing protein